MGYPKKHRGRRKIGSKKRRAKKRNKKIGFVDFFSTFCRYQFMSIDFCKLFIFRKHKICC